MKKKRARKAKSSAAATTRPPPPLPMPPLPPPPPEPGEDGLTRERLEEIIEAIADQCMPRKYAATYCGTSPKTLERWIAQGATGVGGPLRAELARRVFKAEGTKVGGAMQSLYAMRSVSAAAGEAFLKLFKPGDFGGPRPEPDEFDDIERQTGRRRRLWDKPPPKMLREAREAGWWQFSRELSAEDRALLEAIQAKYTSAPALPAAPPEKAS